MNPGRVLFGIKRIKDMLPLNFSGLCSSWMMKIVVECGGFPAVVSYGAGNYSKANREHISIRPAMPATRMELGEHLSGRIHVPNILHMVIAATLLLGVVNRVTGTETTAITQDPALQRAIGGTHRSAEFVTRDHVRNPYEELRVFGIAPDMVVVEVAPGKGYWTEILALYLRDKGTYYVAQFPKKVAATNPAYQKYYDNFQAKLASDKAIYGKVRVSEFGKDHYDIAPPGSADLVLTFRNLHNWMKDGFAEEAFAAFFKALKPGGVLGLEEHRALTNQPQDPKATNGYVRQDYAIALAQKAGFELIESSEMLANPRDTKDYPKGVWTLPPTLILGEQDREKYIAIGEGDNFMLKFRKPLR